MTKYQLLIQVHLLLPVLGVFNQGCKQKRELASLSERHNKGREINSSPSGPLAPISQSNQETALEAQNLQSSSADGPSSFRSFNFSPPNAKIRSMRLWATFYYIPQFTSSPRLDHVIRDTSESNLLGSEKITQSHWCDLALQGSGRVKVSTGEIKTISFSGRSPSSPIDCSPFIQTSAVVEKIRGNRFEIVPATFGRGARVAEVIPYRTLAVDPSVIPYGSVVYIPAARGQLVELASGAKLAHDGYFFAGDTGSAITGSHIDIFTGTVKKTPFSFVQSHSGATFEAWIVADPRIEQEFKASHRFSPGY